MTHSEILNLKENQNLQVVEKLGYGDGVQFLLNSYEFTNHKIDIIKSQWTKTQKSYCVRVYNYYVGKRPHLQIPYDKKKQAIAFIEELKQNKIEALWTGHVVKAGEFIK